MRRLLALSLVFALAALPAAPAGAVGYRRAAPVRPAPQRVALPAALFTGLPVTPSGFVLPDAALARALALPHPADPAAAALLARSPQVAVPPSLAARAPESRLEALRAAVEGFPAERIGSMSDAEAAGLGQTAFDRLLGYRPASLPAGAVAEAAGLESAVLEPASERSPPVRRSRWALPVVTSGLMVANALAYAGQPGPGPEGLEAVTAYFENYGLVPAKVAAAWEQGALRAAESWLGHSRVLAAYLLAGLAGAALHMLLHPDSAIPLVGASGGVAGLVGAAMGAAAVLAARLREQASFGMRLALGAGALWLLLESLHWTAGGRGNIAHHVHVAGLLVGLALGVLYALRDQRSGTPGRAK